MTAKRRKNSVSCETILWLLERTSRCSINSWKKVSTLKTKFQIEICASKTTTQETVDHQHPLNDWTLKNVYIDFWLCMQSCLICVMPFFPWGEICFNEYISLQLFSHKNNRRRRRCCWMHSVWKSPKNVLLRQRWFFSFQFVIQPT